MRLTLRLLFLSALMWLALPVLAQNNADEITPAEIKQVINENSGCESLEQIAIDHLEYFDFAGNGHKAAVVVASTCMTGTAGPDVHAVYMRNAEGKVVEHYLDGQNPVIGPNSLNLPLFGNPNYGIAVEKGQLVARWMDASGRENPLIIWYKWNGQQFAVDHMKVEGPFTTSYDCSKAKKEMDRAICYSPTIAALDVQLAQAYRAATQQKTPDQKRDLQEQQRQWLALREKQCTIYKWWVDCLNDLYTKRIAELKQP